MHRMGPMRFHLALGSVLLAAACAGQVEEPMGDPTFTISADCAADGSCVPVCTDNSDEEVCVSSVPPTQGGCWVTGIGHLEDLINNDGKDNFGGNGMPMKDGHLRGEWEHVDHGTGVKFHAQIAYLVCQHVDEPGPGNPSGPNHNFDINEAYYGGPARRFTPDVGWEDGFWIDIVADDHGEPGNKPGPGQHGSSGPDTYTFQARAAAADGSIERDAFYTAGFDIAGGNFQIHPPNDGHPFTMGELPPHLR